MDSNKTPLAAHKYMELTNKSGLPDIIVKLVSLDTYESVGDISVTALIDSPQIRYLKKTNKVEYDAEDFLWTTMGTAIHNALEFAEYTQYEVKALKQASDIFSRHGHKEVGEWVDKFIQKTFPDHINNNVIQEKRLTVEHDGWVISGKPDRIEVDKKLLIDFKMTSAWIWNKPGEHDKYKYQLSIYRWLLHKYGIEVDMGRIIFIFRDWSQSKTFGNPDYPQKRAEQLDIELMSLEETEIYINNRIALHKHAEKGHFPLCSDKEMWSRGEAFKCYKKRGKNTLKKAMSGGTFETYEEAVSFRAKQKESLMPTEDIVIKHTPARRVRCESFCPVSKFCGQYKDFLNQQNSKK